MAGQIRLDLIGWAGRWDDLVHWLKNSFPEMPHGRAPRVGGGGGGRCQVDLTKLQPLR